MPLRPPGRELTLLLIWSHTIIKHEGYVLRFVRLFAILSPV